MKKWLIGLIVPALIGTVPVSAGAANKQDDPSVKFKHGVITTRQYSPENDYNMMETRLANNRESKLRENSRLSHNRRPRREHDRREEQRYAQEREDARYVINRTASVISRAQRSARNGHYYQGFSRAVAHQHKARELFQARRHREAIFHSLRARELAMHVIRGNRENWPGYAWDDREQRYGHMAPSDRDLDIQVDWSKVGNDDAAVRIRFNLNVN
jgi:hypothetical protein